MVVQLHPEALAEYAEAVGFYEERATGLGREFFEEVQRVLRLVGESPRLVAKCMIAVTCVFGASCDVLNPPLCTTQPVFGVEVSVFDSIDGEPVTEGLAGILVDADYTAAMLVTGHELWGAGERPGVYTVFVTAPGYEPWVKTEVEVVEGKCHVSTERIEANLVPVPPAA